MKLKLTQALLAFGLLGLGQVASAQVIRDDDAFHFDVGHDQFHGPDRRRVYCVGGPRAPTYAFSNPGAAQQCAQRVASASGDCRRAVRVGNCYVFNLWNVDSTPPNWCQCAPAGVPYVGSW